MNRQRKVVITVTYNEMGIIIDTKAEELDLSAQPEQRSFSRSHEDDLISRQAAIDALSTPHGILYPIRTIEQLPPAQPEIAKRIVGNSRDGMTLWYQCDMCNEPVDAQDTFCRGCGRRLTDE